ncbi:MAG: hypothetical protein H0T97_11230 [Actinobacteria bacterium]|nr:hypothetical protein [Actinomycetota bacterium]
MELKIRLKNADPPAGWIVLVGGRQDSRHAAEDALSEVWFSGWLGLLQALDDALDHRRSAAARRPRH